MRILRQTHDILLQTFQDLWAHKLRSALTMFGIAWGMLSLLIMGAVGEGFRQGQRQMWAQWGEDRIHLWGGRIRAGQGTGLTERWLQLTEDDCRLIIERSPLVRTCAPTLGRGSVPAESATNDTVLNLVGVWPNIQGPRYLPVKEGRFINDADVAAGRRVAILGDTVASQLFRHGATAVGSEVRLNQMPFQVVGVLKPIGREGRGGANGQIFVPLSTMRRYFPHWNEKVYPGAVGEFILQPVSTEMHAQAVAQYHAVIGRRHGVDPNDRDAFYEFDSVAEAQKVQTVLNALDVFLRSVGVVTLVLGAIGVMNILLVSVTERTREIGVRKALGATHRDILLLFLMEGLAMMALSGGAGLALGGAITWVLKDIPMPQGFAPPAFTWSLGWEAFAVLCLTALGATIIPSRRAALLPPCEAMQHET
jgi:putative ABC transport system permease protein